VTNPLAEATEFKSKPNPADHIAAAAPRRPASVA